MIYGLIFSALLPFSNKSIKRWHYGLSPVHPEVGRHCLKYHCMLRHGSGQAKEKQPQERIVHIILLV